MGWLWKETCFMMWWDKTRHFDFFDKRIIWLESPVIFRSRRNKILKCHYRKCVVRNEAIIPNENVFCLAFMTHSCILFSDMILWYWETWTERLSFSKVTLCKFQSFFVWSSCFMICICHTIPTQKLFCFRQAGHHNGKTDGK